MTDSTGLGWTDVGGFEADDECAWSPPPFLVGGYGYQFEWSNAANNCVSFIGAGAPPAVPTLTMTNEACNGLNTADWTASSGATAYELWGSSTSTFTFSSLQQHRHRQARQRLSVILARQGPGRAPAFCA